MAASSRKRAPVPSNDGDDEDMSEVKTIGRRPLLDGQAQTSWLAWRAMGLTWEQGLRRMADRNDPQLSLARNLYRVDHALYACRRQTLDEILNVARSLCSAPEEDAAFFAYADSRLLEGLAWYLQQVAVPPLDPTDFDQAGQGDLVWAMDRREDDQLIGLVDLIHRGYGTTWWYLEQAKLTHRERQACAEAERDSETLLHCIQRHEWPTVDRLLFQGTPDPSILVALMEAEGAAHMPLQNPNRDARMQRTFQLLRTYPGVRLTETEAASVVDQADRPLLDFTRSGLLLWLVKAGPQYQWTLRYAIARGLVIRTDEEVLAIVSTPVLDWPLIGVLTRQSDPKLDLGRILSPNRMIRLEAAALQAFRTTGNSVPRETLTVLVMEWRTQRNHTTESPLVMETDDEVSDHDSQRTVSEDDMDQ